MTERTDIELTGKEAEEAKKFVVIDDEKRPVHTVDNGIIQIVAGPYPNSHEDVDVAVFKVREIDPYTPVIPLGTHLDDWLGTSDLVLSEAIVLGYPPIPMTSAPVLFGARAEVNAQVDRYDIPHVHFILSSMPRGGFSGGVAISEYDFVLGVITMSLLPNDQPTELGLMTVLGVESIYECLAEHKLLPDGQAEGWHDYWNRSRLSFSGPGTENLIL